MSERKDPYLTTAAPPPATRAQFAEESRRREEMLKRAEKQSNRPAPQTSDQENIRFQWEAQQVTIRLLLAEIRRMDQRDSDAIFGE